MSPKGWGKTMTADNAHSRQCSLLHMVESWRNTLDQKEIIGAVFVDLSKTFDIIDHNVLIAKVNAYGASGYSLKFIFSYLKNRKQRTAIENSYSPWKEIKALAPQGSILDPLFLNIFIDYLFFSSKMLK